MKSDWEILAIPSDIARSSNEELAEYIDHMEEGFTFDGTDPDYQFLLEPFTDENGVIRKELFDYVDGKYYQKKGLISVNGKLQLPS